MKNKLLYRTVLLCMLCYTNNIWAQNEYQEVKNLVTARLKLEKESQRLRIGEPRADSIGIKGKTIKVFCNDNSAYLSYREDNVQRIYADLKQAFPLTYKKYKIQIWADGRPIEQHIPVLK